MKRNWRYLALVAAGGTLLQFGGCGTLIFDTLVNNLITTLIVQLIESFAGTAAA